MLPSRKVVASELQALSTDTSDEIYWPLPQESGKQPAIVESGGEFPDTSFSQATETQSHMAQNLEAPFQDHPLKAKKSSAQQSLPLLLQGKCAK
jgi:hypothetical protein